jgi:hypothetical protein
MQLEEILSAYVSGPVPQKSALAARVLDEIYQAKRRYGSLVAREERPIEIAGRRRQALHHEFTGGERLACGSPRILVSAARL